MSSKVVKKRSLESNSSESSAEEGSSEVDRDTTNMDAEQDVASNNNRPTNSVVVRPNPAKRIRQSTSGQQVSQVKVDNKSDNAEPVPIEGLDDLRK